jgi:hypothetical protein
MFMALNRRGAFKLATTLALLSSKPTAAGTGQGAGTRAAVDAQAGALEFELGMPTARTVDSLYQALDHQSAVMSYLWAIPIVGMESARQMLVDNAGARSGDFVRVSGYRDVSAMLGSNVTTPYVFAFFDLSRQPLVLHYPPGATAGSLIDWWDRPLCDVGMTGPDAGQGAVFVLLGPGQQAPGELPAGAHLLRSRTFKVLLFCRGLDADLARAETVFSALRVHPPGQRPAASKTRLLRFKPEGELTSMAHPRGLAYWQRLANALRGEPVEDRDRFFAALLAPLGIGADRPFAPDARQQAVLEKAAIVGEATAKAIAFRKRIPGMRYRPDTHWEYLIAPGFDNAQDVPGGTLFEERTAFFYEVTGTSAAVLTRTPGVGAAYLAAYYDAKAAPFDGARSYRLRVPADVPARLFWSVTLYDTQTRGLIRNAQQIVDRSSRQDLAKNADGSVDIVLGPTPAPGLEKNWIPTAPGHSWYVYFRLFGPLAAYFDRTWVLPDIQAL